MSKKKIWIFSIVAVVILGIVANVYTKFHGTPWGRVNANKELMTSIHQEYSGVKYHVSAPTNYNFIHGTYQIGITFDKIPHVTYVFYMQDGKPKIGAIDGAYKPTKEHPLQPVPVPYSTSWLPTSK